MVSITSFISTALFATLALAQQPVTNFTSAQIQGLLTTNANSPNNPNNALRLSWCTGQRTLCGTLCNGNGTNSCDSNTLQWNCTCASNSSTPPLQYYSTSMFANECQALKGNCLAQGASDIVAQTNCINQYVCGNGTDKDAAAAASAAGSQSSTAAASSGTAAPATTGGSAMATSTHAAAAVAAYGEFAPPVFVMAMVGGIAAFL